MIAPLLRELIAAEEPVLAAHGISMWGGYVVLVALDGSSVRTQAALAAAIGADKTRIIRDLDELQERADRAHPLIPTTAGFAFSPSPMPAVR